MMDARVLVLWLVLSMISTGRGTRVRATDSHRQRELGGGGGLRQRVLIVVDSIIVVLVMLGYTLIVFVV